jgi:hypothetical protein
MDLHEEAGSGLRRSYRMPLKAIMRGISATLLLAFSLMGAPGIARPSPTQDAFSLCGGEHFKIETVPGGASPYIGLRVLGVTGQFLLDYGATRSSLSAPAFGATEGAEVTATVPLGDAIEGAFLMRRYNLVSEPEDHQIGVIGTDLLSHLSVELTEQTAFISARPCSADAMQAHGLVAIDQTPFFGADRAASGLPNVPIVFLRLGALHAFAQIDTGYDDKVFERSVDINERLFEDLLKSGADLRHVADIGVATCEGQETRRVYTMDTRLVVETQVAQPIAAISRFHLIVKPASGCGGIGAMSQPAAQLGASFLRDFVPIVFDPLARKVWIERRPDAMNDN